MPVVALHDANFTKLTIPHSTNPHIQYVYYYPQWVWHIVACRSCDLNAVLLLDARHNSAMVFNNGIYEFILRLLHFRTLREKAIEVVAHLIKIASDASGPGS